MKILLPTFEYAPFKGGVAVYLEQLVQELTKQHDITVVAERAKNSFLFDQQQPYTILRTKLLFPFGMFRWIRAYLFLKKLLATHHYDHLIISHVIPMGYIALLLKIPYTVVLHGTDVRHAQKTGVKKYFLSRILQNAKYILVNSEYTRSLIAHEVSLHNKIFVSYPSPKQLPSVSHELHKDQHLKLLSVNRLVPRKGNDTVIEALAEMKKNGVTDVMYTIVGAGLYEATLHELIAKHDLQNQVTILTHISDDELSRVYATHDIFVMPARVVSDVDVEGFGIVYLEAALFGLPSIAGHFGGAPEAVVNGVTGYVVNATESRDVVNAIMHFYTNPELIASMGESARQRAITEFTPSIQFKDFINKLSHEKI